MDELIHRPHGILLVTGPTGSGKTTTLYACLSKINSPDLNILTVEDPVEYQLDGISQVQVNAKIDLTFATGLRSFLRHDPDVIMVGEIRDLRTAEIAIQASLTGHLVLSTIHTNDAAGAITRLVDMGVQPFLVASSLVGLLAQRLVRRLCPECRELYHPDDEEMASWASTRRLPRRAGPAGGVQGRAASAAGHGVPGARGRLRQLPGRRLPGPDRHLRAADDRRHHPHRWPTRTPTGRPSRRRAWPRACAPCATTAPRRCWRA